jgi:hypothetical protein
MWRFLLFIVVMISVAGCKSYCRQLSEKQCECSATSTERTTCLTLAANKETGVTLTAADEDACEALLPKCDCTLVATSEGKVNCGLARPLAEADAGL